MNRGAWWAAVHEAVMECTHTHEILKTKEVFLGKNQHFNRTKHDYRLVGEQHTLNFFSGKYGCCRRPFFKKKNTVFNKYTEQKLF